MGIDSHPSVMPLLRVRLPKLTVNQRPSGQDSPSLSNGTIFRSFMKSVLVSLDVEADGPCPGLYSMVSFGAVVVDDKGLHNTFYGKVRPITDIWVPEALAVSGHTREEHMTFDDPATVMVAFREWLQKQGRCIAIMDNPAFDWQWVNYYFHKYVGSNPFGFSARRIGDIYAGMQRNLFVKWKHLRVTKHTHNPVDDAKGNAEALLAMHKMGLKGIINT